MSDTPSEAPSKPLLAVLGLSLLAAVAVYGRPLLAGDDEAVEEVEVPSDLGFVDDTEVEPEVTRWTAPDEPRNPFLPVDVRASSGDVGDEDDGSGESDDGEDEDGAGTSRG